MLTKVISLQLHRSRMLEAEKTRKRRNSETGLKRVYFRNMFTSEENLHRKVFIYMIKRCG